MGPGSDAKLAAAPGSFVFGGGRAWGLLGVRMWHQDVYRLSSRRKAHVLFHKLTLKGDWQRVSVLFCFLEFSVSATSYYFSDLIFPLVFHATYSRVSEGGHYWPGWIFCCGGFPVHRKVFQRRF